MENYQKTEATADTSLAYTEAGRIWVRSGKEIFAEHLSKIFKPNPERDYTRTRE